jgi:hypothetical protein
VSIIEGSQRRVDVLEFVALARAMGREPGVLFTALLALLPADIDI